MLMKVSIFQEGICYGIDYTSRSDCLAVIDITQEQFVAIQSNSHQIQLVDGLYTVVEIEEIVPEE